MKPIITFSMAAKDDHTPLGHVLNRVAESVQPATAHVIGATSGTTGILLWAEYAKHLTVLVGLAATGTVGPWAWLGVIPLATGAIGWCPPYAIFGWNTCALKK